MGSEPAADRSIELGPGSHVERVMSDGALENGLRMLQIRRDMTEAQWADWVAREGDAQSFFELGPEELLRLALWAITRLDLFERWKHIGPNRMLVCTWLDDDALDRMEARIFDASAPAIASLRIAEVYEVVAGLGAKASDELLEDIELRVNRELDDLDRFVWDEDPAHAEAAVKTIFAATERAVALLARRSVQDGRMGCGEA